MGRNMVQVEEVTILNSELIPMVDLSRVVKQKTAHENRWYLNNKFTARRTLRRERKSPRHSLATAKPENEMQRRLLNFVFRKRPPAAYRRK